MQTGIHSNFLLVSLEVRSQSADHHSVVLLELPPPGDLGEILALQRKKRSHFRYPTKWVYPDSKDTYSPEEGSAKLRFNKVTASHGDTVQLVSYKTRIALKKEALNSVLRK